MPNSTLVDPAALAQMAKALGEGPALQLSRQLFELFSAKVEHLKTACETGDIGEIEAVLHNIASGAVPLGAVALQKMAREIEIACHNGDISHYNDNKSRLLTLAGETVLALQKNLS